ncbi:hypothetical protein DSL72_006777 [Monilinia vaccinii-corymbosi]|uniref:Uncharacterized protein n=1 Tax=Monilinia vaccinii-corymbosi TaxID=61207 RepID=A0A8A3PPR3_9HELO|nr:hypothetical protein DSL72_006777 [Monilinia vaccinii-corymbosi]
MDILYIDVQQFLQESIDIGEYYFTETEL